MMRRSSSRKNSHFADLGRSVCSIELLETRTLLTTATINAADIVNIVPSDMLGVNTAPWDGLLSTSTTLSLSEAAGIDAVRIGGGSTADTWHFNSTTNSESIGQMADYVAELGATGIVTVDYGEGSPQEGVALWAYLNGNPSDTYSIGTGEQWNGSEWVSVNWETVGYWASLRANTDVASNSLGADHPAAFNFEYFEIGNEVYGSWETDEHGQSGDDLPMPAGDKPKAHDPTTLISFAEQFQAEINAIMADGSESGAVPILVGVDSQDVATTPDNSSTFDDWIGNILSQSVAQKFTLGFIADHYYTSVSSGSENDATLLGMSNTVTTNNSSSNPYDWAERASDYDTLIENTITANGAAGEEYLGKVQLIADEVNSISSSPGKQSTSLVNGLFIADAIGAAVESTGADGLGGYQGFWIWDLHNGEPSPDGNTSSSLYGWRDYGDYGIIGNGTGAATNELSPDYFAIQLASKIFGSGGDVIYSTEDNESAIDIYAVLETNGDLELLVINKTDPGMSQSNDTSPPNPPGITEQFNISGFDANSLATIWQYGVNQDDAQASSPTFVSALAESSANLGVTNGDFSYTFPDYSMTVLILTPGASPTIAQAAAANPAPVTGTSTNLSVMGSENGSGTSLLYTWSYTGPTGVTYSGTTNGSNAASNIIANFSQAGTYNFTATITDADNNSTTSSVQVVVQQTLTGVTVSPANSPVVPVGFSQQFTAAATDQFGNAMTAPTLTWSITGSDNSISNSGDATLGLTPGSYTVSAASGGVQGNATVIAEDFAVPSSSSLDINLGSAGPVSLTASGGNITASQNGVQITLSGFTGITVTDTGSADVLDFNGPLALPFTFVNTGNSTVNVLSGTLTLAANMGQTVSIGNLSVANGASAAITASTTDSPTTLSLGTLAIGPTGSFDVANNIVLINYGSGTDPIDTIANWIASGYADGAWNGPGIISSTAQTNPNYGLGYADAADPNNPASLPAGQIKIMYTLLGDANLDGAVNGADFTIIASHFNQSVTAGWDEGDFNYDGAVNGADFTLLAENFNQAAQIAAPAVITSEPAAAVTPVSSASDSATSSTDDSDSNTVVDTVLGKHVKPQKSQHGGRH
jgi:alpha-L-arabinofuranosidase